MSKKQELKMNERIQNETIENNTNETTHDMKGEKKMYSFEEVENTLIDPFGGTGEVYYTVHNNIIIIATFNSFSVFTLKDNRYHSDGNNSFDKIKKQLDLNNLNFIKNEMGSEHFDICRLVYRLNREDLKYVCTMSQFEPCHTNFYKGGVFCYTDDSERSFDLDGYDEEFEFHMNHWEEEILKSEYHSYYTRKRVVTYV